MRAFSYEGVLAARNEDDQRQPGELFVLVTKPPAEGFHTIEGKRVRVTVQIIDDDESFDEIMGSEEVATPEDIWP